MDGQEVEEETWADKTWLIHEHRLVGRPTHTAIQARTDTRATHKHPSWHTSYESEGKGTHPSDLRTVSYKAHTTVGCWQKQL